MGYLRAHWLGQQPLAWSFWINFALPFLLMILVANWLSPPLVERVSTFALLAGSYFILVCLGIYSWQLVGLMRACDRYLDDHRNATWTSAIQRVTVVQGAMIASFLVIAITTISLVLDGVSLYVQRSDTADPKIDLAAGYSIRLERFRGSLARCQPSLPPNHPQYPTIAGGWTGEKAGSTCKGDASGDDSQLIHIDGNFEIGLSNDLKQLLTNNEGIEGIVLNSRGGRVFEARAVAKQIRERGSKTYVFEDCLSACTTAFIAGKRRYLAEGARLGFHGYRLQSVLPTIDVDEEQEKDLAFYRAQGVAPAWLDKIFSEPHESIWFPDQQELVGAGVVHRIIPARQ